MTLNLVTSIHDFNENYLFFCEPIRNNVINGGNFIRLLYSTVDLTMNGLFIELSLENSEIEKQFTKYKCNFSPAKHKDLVSSLSVLEHTILTKHNISPVKRKKLQLAEQFSSGSVKLFDTPSLLENSASCKNYLLKISGIWETDIEYGLTFKLTQV
jgi:hypothetical protein